MWNPQGEKNTENASIFMAENNSITADHEDQNAVPVYHNPTSIFKHQSYTAHLKNG